MPNAFDPKVLASWLAPSSFSDSSINSPTAASSSDEKRGLSAALAAENFQLSSLMKGVGGALTIRRGVGGLLKQELSESESSA
jgi:hypothetical protein